METGLGFSPGLFDGSRVWSGTSRVVFFDVRDGFVYFYKGENDQSCDEEKNQRQDSITQASKYLIGQPENEWTDPGCAAFADLVKGVKLSFFSMLGSSARTGCD